MEEYKRIESNIEEGLDEIYKNKQPFERLCELDGLARGFRTFESENSEGNQNTLVTALFQVMHGDPTQLPIRANFDHKKDKLRLHQISMLQSSYEGELNCPGEPLNNIIIGARITKDSTKPVGGKDLGYLLIVNYVKPLEP